MVSIVFVPMKTGRACTLDYSDYEKLNGKKISHVLVKNRKVEYCSISIDQKPIALHRWVMGVGKNRPIIDHINGDGTDNRKSNLRVSDHSLNQANRKNIRNKYGWKGLAWDYNLKQYVARLEIKGKSIYCGCSKSADVAAMLYNIKAYDIFGDHSYQNISKLNIQQG